MSLIHENKFSIPMKSAAALCLISQLRDGSERESARAVSATIRKTRLRASPTINCLAVGLLSAFCHLSDASGGTEMAEENRNGGRREAQSSRRSQQGLPGFVSRG